MNKFLRSLFKNLFKNYLIYLVLFVLFVSLLYLKDNQIDTFNDVILIEKSIYGKFKCFKGDDTICKSIIETGSWEPHILDILIKNYKPNTNFFGYWL